MTVSIREGRRLVTGVSWANRRTRVRDEFFTVRRAARRILVASNLGRSRDRFFEVEEDFAEFFDNTFAGWTEEVQAARIEEARIAAAEAVMEEASDFDAFLTRLVISGVATTEEVLRFTTGWARSAGETGYARGYELGRTEGDYSEYSRGYDEGYEFGTSADEYSRSSFSCCGE